MGLGRNHEGVSVGDNRVERVRHDTGAGGTVTKEGLLTIGAIRVDQRRRGGTAVVTRGARKAKAKPLEGRVFVIGEGRRKQAGRIGEVPFDIGVVGRGVATVDHTVGDGQLVAEALFQHGAVKLHAHIAIGREVVGDGTLVEERDGIRLKLFKADGGLEATRLDVEGRIDRKIQVGVEDGDRAAREFGLHDVAETFCKLAFKNEAGAAQEELILTGGCVGIIKEETRVSLHETAQAERVGAVGGGDFKAAFAGGDLGEFLRVSGGGLGGELGIALKDAEFLVEQTDLLAERFNVGSGGVLRRERREGGGGKRGQQAGGAECFD